jgi:arylsulfatase
MNSRRITKRHNRRDFIKTVAASTVFGSNLIGCNKKARKPNLLFIWTDEQRADTMEVYGNSTIITPNLNKLASESIVFRNAYVSQPVCTPARSTVMTGLWPHTNGCVQNNIPLSADIPCLNEMLNDPDYQSAFMGKWHLGDEVFNQHGFGEWVSIEDMYVKYYTEGRDRVVRSSYWHWLKDLGYKPDREDGIFSREFTARLPLEHCKPKFLERESIDFLSRHRGEPFILYINFLEPHMPFFGPLDHLHHPENVKLPANFDDPLEENEPLRYKLRREKFLREGFEGHDLKTEEGWRNLIARYWGLVSQVDLSVGAILDALENFALADNTIVVFTSDHGDMMGSHHILTKMMMYEEAARVPWLIRIPEFGRKQALVEQRVSHIDLVPTLLELMNRSPKEDLPGSSLVPLIEGGKPAEDHVFIEWNPFYLYSITPHSIPSVCSADVERVSKAAIRTVISPDGWKLCLSDKDKCQLFNLNRDPGETVNLFNTSGYHQVAAKLTERIFKWQQDVKDDLVLNV